MVLDNFRTIELIWDKANKSIIKTIKTASSDTTGRYLSVKVLDGGQEVTLNNAKLQLYWEHPNFNTSGTDDFNIVNNGGLFSMTFSKEMLTNIGELNAHLVLTLPDGKITSDGFAIEVIKGANDGVVVPTNGKGLVKQIEGKIDKGNVTLNDLTQEVKKALTGGAVAVVGENSVSTINIVDNTVTPPKTSFMQSGKNLFAGNYKRGYLTSTAPYFVEDPNALTSVEAVEPNTTYTISKSFSNRFRVALSQSHIDDSTIIGRELIKSTEDGGSVFTFTTGGNDRSVLIFLVSSSDRNKVPDWVQLEAGEVATPYEEHQYKIDSLFLPEQIQHIQQSKNLFKGDYIDGIYMSPSSSRILGGEDASVSFVDVDPNTTYTISKTPSDRFRLGLNNISPNISFEGIINYPIDEVIDLDANLDRHTFTTGSNHHALMFQGTSIGQNPSFVQVEKGPEVTEWESFGYKITPESKPYRSDNDDSDNADGFVYVEDYMAPPLTESGAIQMAFDEANRQIVVFKAGKKYVVENTLTANASKVVGILGNNAIIEGHFNDGYVLKYEGTLTGSAGVSGKTQSDYDQLNTFIDKLKVSGTPDYTPDGIYINKLFMFKLINSSVYKTRNAVTIGNRTRNLIISTNHIYNNKQDGLLFDKSSLHQIIVSDNHISYNLNAIKFIGGDLANIQINNNSLESSSNDYFTNEDSIVVFEPDDTGRGRFEVVIISGNNIQAHHGNQRDLIDINLNEDQMPDLTMTGNHIGNTGSIASYVRLKGVSGGNITGNTLAGFPNSVGKHSIVLEGVNKHINISGNNLDKPVNWDNSDINKMIIAGNVLEMRSMENRDDGNIIVTNNL